MNKYIYKIYGVIDDVYELIEITYKLERVIKYQNNDNYKKVLIIRHDIELDMDEPLSLTFSKKSTARVRR